jgi:heme a synthase
MVTAMVVVGGITRLTQSGLSMVKWEPIVGAIPPLSEAAWQEEFEAYQASPEFEFYNNHFTLSDFKKIYFWEYFHRLLGRIVGLVFLFPCIYFWWKGAFSSKLKKQVAIIFLGGLFQGVLGWYMVMSGLVDKPYVSHYRLAAHLLTALALAAYILWVAFDVKGVTRVGNKIMYRLGWTMIVLLGVQILYGAFVAGLKAGLMYNTFPMMGRTWIPVDLGIAFQMLGGMALIESQVVVQMIHRVLAVTVFIMALAMWWGAWKCDSRFLLSATSLVAIVTVQFLLGVLTLIYAVPVSLGVLHQFGAVLLLMNVVHLMYISKVPDKKKRAVPVNEKMMVA